ncbi:MAG: TolC family protein [Luteibaculaceae bacterium]
MIKKTLLFFSIILLINIQSKAQDMDDMGDIANAQLNYEQFVDWVKAYHPVAKQANLEVKRGFEQLRAAKGLFDPLIYSDWKGKEFQNTRYYSQRAAGVHLPTRLGVDFIGQYEQNTGTFLNPELTVPDEGLFTAGLAINIGNGLLIDRFRAARQKAVIFNDAAANIKDQILNNLFLEASITYWNWSGAYNETLIIEDALELAKERFIFVKQAYIGGELPAIDTIEAYGQVQLREFQLQEANRKLTESRLDLSVFLWDENEEPVVPTENTKPELPNESLILMPGIFALKQNLKRHPELIDINFRLDALDVDRRLQAELLRPRLALQYNFLSEAPGGGRFTDVPQFTTNNYTYGINFSFPLFNRTARANLQLAKIQIQETGYTFQLTEQRLAARLDAEYNNFVQIQQQVLSFGQNVFALQRLLDGERIRFEVGESSLFFVNARENALIDASVVFNNLHVRKNISAARTRWASGRPF